MTHINKLNVILDFLDEFKKCHGGLTWVFNTWKCRREVPTVNRLEKCIAWFTKYIIELAVMIITILFLYCS